MGEQVFGLDPELAMDLASACRSSSEVAGGLADEVGAALSAGWLSSRSATLLSEVENELTLLGRVIAGTADGARAADAWQLASPSAIAGRLITDVLERMLWDGLNDSVGASAIDVGPFDLSESFRTMGRGQWRAATSLPGCVSFGPGRYYTGGGALLGPDNRLYPVVVPHLVTDDGRHYTIDADIGDIAPSVASLGGADPGWTMVDYRTGIERVQAEPGGLQTATTGVAVATGLEFAAGVDDSNLAAVYLRAGAPAVYLDSMPVVGPAGLPDEAGAALNSPEPTVWLMVDGHVGQYPISDVPDLPLRADRRQDLPRPQHTGLGRAQAIDNVFALTTQAVSGFVAARDLDHGRHRAYEVIFEEHADGRRRSRVQTFTLEAKDWGKELFGWHLFVDEAGVLQQSPVAYQYGPSLTSETTRVAHNPADPEFVTHLGDPAFTATAD